MYDSHCFLRVPAPSYEPSPSSLNSTKDPVFRLVSTISVHSITTEPDEREPPECWLPSRPLLHFLLCLGITPTGHANSTLPFTASVPFAHEIELVTLRNSEESNRGKDELRREYSIAGRGTRSEQCRGKNAVQL